MQNLNIKDSIRTIVLVLIFCVISQFMNMHMYWSLALFLMLIIVPTFIYKRIYPVPKGQLFVLLFAMSTYFFVFRKNNSVMPYHYVVYFVGPILFYYAGMYFMMLEKKNYREFFFDVLLVASLGGSLYACLCIINKQLNLELYNQLFEEAGIIAMMRERYMLNIWSDELIHPTNLNSYCVFSIINLYPAYRFEKRKRQKVLFYFAGLMGVFVCLKTATRSNLLFLALSIVFTILFTLKKMDFSDIKIERKKMFLVIAAVLLLLLLADQLVNILQDSALGQRIQNENASLENGRFERMYTVFSQLLNYPFGNMPFGHAHNMWLDVARVSGVIPMIFMILYTCGTVISCLKLSVKKIPMDIRVWAQTIICVMFLTFQIEPVLEGRPYVFMLFCFLAGMIKIMEKKKVNG